jgi:hypothetical protein
MAGVEISEPNLSRSGIRRALEGGEFGVDLHAVSTNLP